MTDWGPPYILGILTCTTLRTYELRAKTMKQLKAIIQRCQWSKKMTTLKRSALLLPFVVAVHLMTTPAAANDAASDCLTSVPLGQIEVIA